MKVVVAALGSDVEDTATCFRAVVRSVEVMGSELQTRKEWWCYNHDYSLTEECNRHGFVP